MTGLKAIISQISDDAELEAQRTLREADETADKILQEGAQEAAAVSEALLAEGTAQAASIKERASSAAQLEKRNKILLYKQNLIQKTIEDAQKELASASDDKYIKLLVSLYSRFAAQEEGVMYFNAFDLARLPANFVQQLEKAVPGSKVTVSNESKSIENGFLLIYGGVDINCTLRAVFEDAQDELRDCVCKALFPSA